MNKFKKATLLAVILTVGLVAGCAVDQREINAATEICKGHGGIKWIYAFPSTEVHCKDNGVIGKNLNTQSN